jgi:dienelactone hydrolase
MDSAVRPGDIRTRIRRDGVELAAHLLLPAAATPPEVIFVHGLGSGKDSPRNVAIAERVRDAGIAALLFDLSGHGESSADPRGEDTDAYCDDLVAVFDWLQSRGEVDGARIGISGSSLGGVVALDAMRSRRVSPISAVLRAPPLSAHDLEAVSLPALVLVGSRDPLSSMLEVAPRSAHVRVVTVADASHLFEEPGTLERALEETVAWFRRTLSVPVMTKERQR